MTDLLDYRAPHSGSPTSKAAAKAIAPVAGAQEAAVYEYIVQCGLEGATDIEIQEHLDLRGSSERPRRRKLVQKGLVIASGNVRKGSNGRESVVWVARVIATEKRD